MTRPASHREQCHDRCCGNCVFAHWIAYKPHLLCFHGDYIEEIGHDSHGDECILMDGDEVGMLEGDEYDRVWGGRSVDPDDVCNEWEQK